MINTSKAPITWFVTGASSGIGLALTEAAAARGDNVVALARHIDALSPLAAAHAGRITPVAADVRRQSSIDDAVALALHTYGRIDVVANNAGYGLFGAVEEVDDEQAREIFDTNFFGVLTVLRATLPILRRQRAGHILQGSSYYGQTAHAGVGLLAATKCAIEGLTDALLDEVAPLGIDVTLVEPGPTATPFLANLHHARPIDDYDRTVREVQRQIGELPPTAFNDPNRVAAAILTAVDSDTPPVRLVTGGFAVTEIDAALRRRRDELAAWHQVSCDVDVAAAPATV